MLLRRRRKPRKFFRSDFLETKKNSVREFFQKMKFNFLKFFHQSPKSPNDDEEKIFDEVDEEKNFDKAQENHGNNHANDAENFSNETEQPSSFFANNFSKPPQNNFSKKIACIVFLICLVIVGLVGVYLFSLRAVPLTLEKDAIVYVRIEPGMTASDIGEMLEQKQIIANKYKFWLNVKLAHAESEIKTGTYQFLANTDVNEVLETLVQGKTTTIRFTIPEGFTVEEIARRLEDEGICDAEEFRQEAKNFRPYDYIKQNEYAVFEIEGFLFPDTYEITSDTTPKHILHMMAETFDKRLTPEIRQRAAEKNLSIYELVTLASLIEKEVRFDEDRPIVAQVFLKRLNISMPLQSDTTIQYLLATPKEDLTYADTEIQSVYNTYQNYGLPPGPIANPGLDSIEAVLSPADTDFLYFVADRQGHNHYAHSYEEHLALVEQVR